WTRPWLNSSAPPPTSLLSKRMSCPRPTAAKRSPEVVSTREELRVVELRGVLDWQACERLQCRAANQLSKCACKGGLGPEEIKPSEHAADAVNQANLLGLRLEDAEKVIDVTGPAIETVAEGAGWRGGTKRKKRLADAIPHRTLIGKAQPAFLEV